MLGEDLFTNHREAYSALAGQIISDMIQQPRLSDSAREAIFQSALPVLYLDDPNRFDDRDASPLGPALAKFYCNVCAGAYAVAQSEDWHGLDASQARLLLNEVRPLSSSESPSARAGRVMNGVAGESDGYVPLISLITGQPAFQRVYAFGEEYDFYPDDELGPLLENDERASRFAAVAVALGWRGGITLFLLEQLGAL